MITIRDAQQEDAGQIAPLMDIIFDEMELDVLDDVSEPGLAKVITKAYQTDTYLYDKATTVVAEADGQVVGVAFGYPSENETDINQVLYNLSKQSADFTKPFIADSETNLDEWYLDSIAVDPNYQGHGIGSKLLRAVPNLAKNDHKAVVGLNVDYENPNAKRLYEKMGFKTIQTQMIGDHQYFHMQKKVNQNELISA
ncbi:GNAT family N-acetyltransferase [Lentilactobacillus laojiaonis]|uniref:GNAT family N-acetyltransferase n=1 Tax=Lentilactobacillus laojiaonis TaxID=2883998 RepID=UPI001D0A20DC|nr:GNAT family N-acetyltransferase [Lentilactobacillus laojiaonis]UDM32338.1 GNAT family N-acetyltransferase [Lentilactobacillus laojiaonis]